MLSGGAAAGGGLLSGGAGECADTRRRGELGQIVELAGEGVAVGFSVGHEGDSEILHVVGALHPPGDFAAFVRGGEHHEKQKGRDNHQREQPGGQAHDGKAPAAHASLARLNEAGYRGCDRGETAEGREAEGQDAQD